MRTSSYYLLFILASILVFSLLVGISWYTYPYPYDFTDTNISRLGRPSFNPDGHLYWTAGILGAAVLLLFYYPSLDRWRLGEPDFDRWIGRLKVLCYLSCIALAGLGIVNADYKIPHKIIGGTYFFTDMAMMAIGWKIIRGHPRVDPALAWMCLLSGLTDALFIFSRGKMSWAEWLTVALSFAIALWLALNGRRLEAATPVQSETAATRPK